MKRKIIAVMIALAFVAGTVPASIEVQKSFTAQAAKKMMPTPKEHFCKDMKPGVGTE